MISAGAFGLRFLVLHSRTRKRILSGTVVTSSVEDRRMTAHTKRMSQNRSSMPANRNAEVERTNRVSLVLVALGMALLAAAGLLLWWRYGPAVFGDMVLSALAWCF